MPEASKLQSFPYRTPEKFRQTPRIKLRGLAFKVAIYYRIESALVKVKASESSENAGIGKVRPFQQESFCLSAYRKNRLIFAGEVYNYQFTESQPETVRSLFIDL